MVDRVTFSTSLPSAELVRKFPSLRRAAVLQQELVQDAYLNLSEQLEQSSENFGGNDPEAAREAFDVYNRVVKDGRYASLLATDPAKAAKLSDVAVSKEALGIIKKAGSAVLGSGGEVQNPAIAPIAVAVAVAVVTKGSNPAEEIIIDQSGMIKM